jgi:uncharacterized protein (TIGR02452 family)
MNKEELIKVYQHTKGICSDFPTPLSLKHTTKIVVPNIFHGKTGKIIVEPMDTVSALLKYGNQSKTAVLNMASSKRKGGGVENGSMAQEECLFRCSNLYMIPDAYYPIASNEFIYTHTATFVKNSDYSTIIPIDCDVITMPAVNLNKTHIDNKQTQDSVENYDELMTFKIEQILSSAILNGCGNLILGAWGCGVFKNDPKVVAELFNKALSKVELRMPFENIVFAVINDKNSVANNYQIFLDTIKK